MIAKILNNNRVYYSPVFAVNLSYANSKAVVFDELYSKLIVVDIYERHRTRLLFMDFNYDNFAINTVNFKSYWNNKDIFKIIKKNKYTLGMFEDAKSILNKCNFSEFNSIKSKSDIEALEYSTGSFHDAYILGMTQNNDVLEIFINTTWGSFVILKCEGIIENTLKIGDVFFHCDMRIDDNRDIEFSFDSENDESERCLRAKNMNVKLLFDKIFIIKSFDYSLRDDEMILQFNNNKLNVNYKDINNNILDLKERNVVGYFESENDFIRCFILLKDFIITFYNLGKDKEILIKKFEQFRMDCQKININFDGFPFIDYAEPLTEDTYGEILHKEEYGKIRACLYELRYVWISILVWNLLWLIIKLSDSGSKWAVYYIFGLGGTAFMLLIITIIFLKGVISKNSFYQAFIQIREKGLIFRFNCCTTFLSYDVISKVEKQENIIIRTTDNKKYKIYKSKNDEYVYKLILSNVGKIKESKTNI